MFGIKINNYRSLSNQQFDFSKVNVLIGENSSGKSSLIKFLLFLKSSSILSSSSFKFNSDIGKYSDFVQGHDNNLDISFEFFLGKNYIDFFVKQLSDKEEFQGICQEISELTGDDQKVTLSFCFNKDVPVNNSVNLSIKNSHFGEVVVIRKSSNEENIIQGEQCILKFYSQKSNCEIELDEVSYDQHGFFSITNGIDVKSKLEKKDDIDISIFYDIVFLLVSQNYTQELLRLISYINPISSTPERSYNENDNQGSIYKVKDISDVVNILSDQTLDKGVRNKLLQELNQALRFYGILYEVKILASDFGPKELKVKLRKDGIWSNIKDVGYGSSLQIPIIFQALIGKIYGGETVIIEQPEVHVHPLLQSKFIETLIKISNKNTYIIETHSPDIVRKLQVLVKNEKYKLSPKDVNIYYFKKPNNLSEITRHQINENGKLTPKFPSGFYDSSVNLVKELF